MIKTIEKNSLLRTFLLSVLLTSSCNTPDAADLLRDKFYRRQTRSHGTNETWYPLLEQIYTFENGKLRHLLKAIDYRRAVSWELENELRPYNWVQRALESNYRSEIFSCLCFHARRKCEKPRQDLCLMELANQASLPLSTIFPESGTWEEGQVEPIIQLLQSYQYREMDLLDAILQQLQDGVSICDLVFDEEPRPSSPDKSN